MRIVALNLRLAPDSIMSGVRGDAADSATVERDGIESRHKTKRHVTSRMADGDPDPRMLHLLAGSGNFPLANLSDRSAARHGDHGGAPILTRARGAARSPDA